MTLSKFLSAIKDHIHRLGYNTSQIDVEYIDSITDNQIHVMLVDKCGEEFELIIEE